MKVNFWTTVMGSLALVLGFSSCSKEEDAATGRDCYECSKRSFGYTYSETFCLDDFDSRAEMKQYVSYYQRQGYTCK